MSEVDALPCKVFEVVNAQGDLVQNRMLRLSGSPVNKRD
jgi:hypothetical protein